MLVPDHVRVLCPPEYSFSMLSALRIAHTARSRAALHVRLIMCEPVLLMLLCYLECCCALKQYCLEVLGFAGRHMPVCQTVEPFCVSSLI